MLIAGCLIFVAGIEVHRMTEALHHYAELTYLLGEGTCRGVEGGLGVGEAYNMKSHDRSVSIDIRVIPAKTPSQSTYVLLLQKEPPLGDEMSFQSLVALNGDA